MKKESGGSPKQLPAAPESAEIFDFLYVDRARVSALYAQLYPQGILTSVKTTAQQSSAADNSVGTDVKLIKGEAKFTENESEGIEHQFDASWSVPLDVIVGLRRRDLVRESQRGAGLGSIVSAECVLRIIDFASMDNMWEPALKIFTTMGNPGSQQIIPEVIPTLTEALKAVPKAIHAHFLTKEAHLWASLHPGSLTIPVTDLTLKYGGQIGGVWQVLYHFDAWSDAGDTPDVTDWSGGDIANAVLTAMHGLRRMMGRPAPWLGITPLMIYRSAAGWLPNATVERT